MDFIVRKPTEYRQVEFERRRTIHVKDFECSVVQIEDLILSKLEWARSSLSELQLNDVRDLLAARNEIDIAYVKSWV
jgi:hypothetical protein